MPLVTAEFIYAGLPDYWGGDGDRWDDDKGCLFSTYGKDSTVKDIVEDAVADFMGGGDCDSLSEEVTDGAIRAALLDCLSDEGRKDYHNDVVSELAVDYADANELDRCRGCSESMGDEHDEDCEILAGVLAMDAYAGCVAEDIMVTEEDCNEDECCDSPMVVFLIKTTVCDECGDLAEHHTDELCEACAKKHGYVEDSVPEDFPVRPLGQDEHPKGRVTCGTCGRSWDDSIATGWTPAPSGRCPFEYFH
jgi:hypothetical protein